MADYQLTATGVIRAADGAVIPNDEGNQDWRLYLDWLAADEANIADAIPTPPPQTIIPSGVFLDRFTQAEQAGVQALALTNANIALGLTMGLARGWIDLNGPLLAPWMAGLVAAGVLTPARRTAIITP